MRELQLQFMGGHLPPLHKIPGLISTESEAWWGMIFLRITLAEQPEGNLRKGMVQEAVGRPTGNLTQASALQPHVWVSGQ